MIDFLDDTLTTLPTWGQDQLGSPHTTEISPAKLRNFLLDPGHSHL